jgi:hypothetical protein
MCRALSALWFKCGCLPSIISLFHIHIHCSKGVAGCSSVSLLYDAMMFGIADVKKRYGDVRVIEDSKDKIITVC